MITREIVKSGYPIKPLGEVVDFLDHMRRPVKQSERAEGHYPYFGANGQQGTIDGYIFDEPLVLVAEDGGHFSDPDRGIAYQIEGKTWVNNHAHVLRPKSKIDIRFLTRVLENYDVRPFISGTTRAKLTKGQAENIEIPLPPLEEQRRIAAILDQADALCRLRARAHDRLNSLGQAIFHEMFMDLVDFESVRLSDLVRDGDKINYGVVQPGEEIEGGVRLLRAGDILSPSLDPRDFRTIDASVDEKHKKSRLKGDEILIACVGSIGAVSLAHPGLCGVNIARAVARVPVDQSKANRVFLAEQIKTQRVQNYFKREIRLVAQPTLNIKQITEAEIFLPPITEQNRFATVLGSLTLQRKTLEESNNKLNALFYSLQHLGFRGKL
jgi:type I restriction enzyme S subunit